MTPLTCLRREMQDVSRQEGHHTPETLAQARQRAADLGPAHPLFDNVRGCMTILRYACYMRLFTMRGWALPVGVSRDSGASEVPVVHRDSVRRTLGN